MTWKVINQRSGIICALAGTDAKMRPTHEETLLWEGDAATPGDAFAKAMVHDPRIEWGPHGYRLRKLP